jgi:NTE family protein
MNIRGLLLFCLLLGALVPHAAQGQRVGVVLSGGGSSGLAHVGVLKALEEQHIPIDYIAGTSMGALVGGMYAMGFPPAEIERLVLSDTFQSWVFGKVDERYIYYFREREANSSWIGLKFRIDSTLRTTLPTNIISPVSMDLAILERTAPASAAAGYNFDSLFVPYRAVAADIHNKAEVVFRDGDLGQAMRASATYPFFFKPIVVNDKLLFDGGLYNNFPADVMYHDFLPDVIIGSTVAVEMSPPDEDDILGQIKNMLMERQSYGPVCDNANMLIIRPDIPKVGILDFSQSAEIIHGGYHETLERMGAIMEMVGDRRQDALQLEAKRAAFKARLKPLHISALEISGLNRNQTLYIRGVMGARRSAPSLEAFRQHYFRMAEDDRIRKIYPSARADSLGGYRLRLTMKTDKDLYAQFGGVFSSRPINTGFVALRYKRIGRIGLAVDGNAYFGKFYGSTQVKATLDFPFKLPFLIEADFTLNNYDFFNSATTFFEEIRPSYLIQYERSGSVAMALPVSNHGKVRLGASSARMFDDYYQVESFTKADTADRTEFNHGSVWMMFERSTLNRKYYASAGHLFRLTARYIDGQEVNTPGSTTFNKDIFRNTHQFFRVRLTWESYFNKRGVLRPGVFGEMVLSNQPFFNNYTASVIAAPAFAPIYEGRTRFMPVFRAHNYAAGGLRLLFALHTRVDLRLEGYVFQPYQELLANNLSPVYGSALDRQHFQASAALVFHTPAAPIALSFNYFDKEEKPFSLLFTAGFLIFNRRVMD